MSAVEPATSTVKPATSASEVYPKPIITLDDVSFYIQTHVHTQYVYNNIE